MKEWGSGDLWDLVTKEEMHQSDVVLLLVTETSESRAETNMKTCFIFM